jgi:hypothetical protein
LKILGAAKLNAKWLMERKIIAYRIIYVCLVKLPVLKAFLCKAFVLAIKRNSKH